MSLSQIIGQFGGAVKPGFPGWLLPATDDVNQDSPYEPTFPKQHSRSLKQHPQLANRVIDPDQVASHFHPMAVYGDETSYPGIIYPWLGTLRLLNGLANPDVLHHVGFGGGARRFSINPRTCANRARDTATSASWNVTYRPWRTSFAPILTSFSCGVVCPARAALMSLTGQNRKSRRGHGNVCCWG